MAAVKVLQYNVQTMKLNQKFDYKSISRVSVDGHRHYSLPDGSRVPSVTTILDATKPIEKIQALDQWRKRVGAENAKQITTEAANRGTRMHSYLEYYIRNGQMKERGSNPFSWDSHAMAQVVIDEGLIKTSEVWGIEANLFYSGLYAGTTDCVGLWQDNPAIIDFKQTNKPKKESWIDDYKLQLAAYALAHNNMFGTDIQTGVIVMCVKPAEGQRPQYQEFTVSGSEFQTWSNRWWDRVEQYYAKINNKKIG